MFFPSFARRSIVASNQISPRPLRPGARLSAAPPRPQSRRSGARGRARGARAGRAAAWFSLFFAHLFFFLFLLCSRLVLARSLNFLREQESLFSPLSSLSLSLSLSLFLLNYTDGFRPLSSAQRRRVQQQRPLDECEQQEQQRLLQLLLFSARQSMSVFACTRRSWLPPPLPPRTFTFSNQCIGISADVISAR